MNFLNTLPSDIKIIPYLNNNDINVVSTICSFTIKYRNTIPIELIDSLKAKLTIFKEKLDANNTIIIDHYIKDLS